MESKNVLEGLFFILFDQEGFFKTKGIIKKHISNDNYLILDLTDLRVVDMEFIKTLDLYDDKDEFENALEFVKRRKFKLFK